MNMMRFEAKHKVLKNIIRNGNNYTNLPTTIANKHQEIICQKSSSFEDIKQFGKVKPLEEQLIESFKSCLDDISNVENQFLRQRGSN